MPMSMQDTSRFVDTQSWTGLETLAPTVECFWLRLPKEKGEKAKTRV